MNNNKPITLFVAGLVLVVAAVGYVYYTGGDEASTPQTPAESASTTDDGTSTTGHEVMKPVTPEIETDG